MSADGLVPDGFAVGHWSDAEAATGCTVVLAPPDGAVASADVRGGGPGTREIDLLDPLANAAHIHAVLLTGGSAFGLAAADGVVRWLERNDRGYETPGGLVPLVPTAVVYDLMSGDPRRRPGPDEGEAACEAASSDDFGLGSVGAGTGAAVGKLRGREFAVKSGVGLARQHLPQGAKLVALAVVNAFGDVIADDGSVLAGTRGDDGAFIGTTRQLRTRLIEPPSYRRGEPVENTTLVCLMTDADLTKTDCGIVAKMAHAGMARAVDPVHSAVDGDVTFALASGAESRVDPLIVGIVGAALTAEAIRDACYKATSVAGIPALPDLLTS
jgi:L-aminopeptidase/D-esterase-like protein